MKNLFYFATLLLIIALLNIANAQNYVSENIIESNSMAQDTNKSDSDTIEYDFKNQTNYTIPLGIKQKCSVFFNNLMNETVSKAYDNLFKNSPISRNQNKIRNIIVSTLKAIEIYGKLYGFESVGISKLSPSYYKVKYFSLHSLNPIEWTFTFYKSPTVGWIILNFKFSDTF